MKLDDRDLQLLRLVARNGRMSKAALAEAINLSASAAHDRLIRLEKAGLIAGYGARLNLRKLGPHVIAFVPVELSGHQAADFQRFEATVARYPEIAEVWSLGGGIDYMLKVVTTDIETYQRLIDELLDAQIGIVRYTTHVVTRAVQERPAALALLPDV